MHERGVVEDLIRHAESLCADRSAPASRINITVGALSGLDPGHIQHYAKLLIGESSPLAGAELVIDVSDDISDPAAGSLRIDSMTFQDG
jgi:Zn finger protein HypA/HybF involved in hydrogenase expression